MAAGLALLYLLGALAGWRTRVRASILGTAAFAVVVVPTAGFIVMGEITDRPYGQDGGVVQLPLALDRILEGRSPYGGDYSQSVLGRQARVSGFWAEHGGNPILRHHAYLPGTHVLMLPFHLLGRAVGVFDPRFVTLLAWMAAGWLAARLAGGGERGLCAAAAVLVNPLIYWHQVFGANDLLPGALLLASVVLARGGRTWEAGAMLGLACATKQLAWPFAPFLLVWMSGVRGWRELLARPAWARLVRPLAAAALVFAVAVVPIAALDVRAFWADVVVYNAGLLPGDNYPLGGTPGFGFANLLIYFGQVESLRDHVSFAPFYLLLVPLGLLLLRRVLRDGTAAAALSAGCAALLLSLYVSRVVHPNYLVLAAALLPLAFLMGLRAAVDVAVVPLVLLASAVELIENAVLQAVWADAVAVRLPQHVEGLSRSLVPRAGAHLTLDPFGLGIAALAAALAVAYLVVGLLSRARAPRVLLLVLSFLVVAVAPVAVTAAAARASGVTRVQAPWGALRAGGRPTEMFAQSFRRDPPRALAAPAAARRDPRGLVLLAVAAAAALAAGLARGPHALAVAGLALVSPPAALGALYGSGDALVLAAVLAAAWLWLSGRRSALSGAVIASGVLVAAAPLLARADLALPAASVGPANLALYAGWWSETLVWGSLAAAALALAAAGRAVSRADHLPPALGLAAAALLAATWWAAAGSPYHLLAPVILSAAAVARIDPPSGAR